MQRGLGTSTASSGVWNVDEIEWIIEARCWVLRNRAWARKGLGLFLLGHDHAHVSGCGGWLGPALTKLLVLGVWWVCCFPAGCLGFPGSGDDGVGGPARILRTV